MGLRKKDKTERDLDQQQSNLFLTYLEWKFGVFLCHPPLNERKKDCVVDSKAPVHTLSKKDLNSLGQKTVRASSKKDLSDAEMEILTKSCSPTIVITANGEVHTNEEETVYVKDLDLFVTVQLLEDTPPILSRGN